MSLKSKSQVSLEFMMVMATALFLGMVLISVTGHFYSDKIDEQNMEVAKEIVISVENELLVASKVRGGYSRTFELPGDINAVNYSIILNADDIILTYKEFYFIGIAPNVTGNLVKGFNNIQNVEGRVCVNVAMC